jgi:hypothetical protein
MVMNEDLLPKPLRDFHDQKRVFLHIWDEVIEERNAKTKKDPYYHDYMDKMTWVGAQVFTMDFFLQFMAEHGYTLQKCRSKKYKFKSLHKTMKGTP